MKKLLSVIAATIMLVTCAGINLAAAEEIEVSFVNVLEDAYVSSASPDEALSTQDANKGDLWAAISSSEESYGKVQITYMKFDLSEFIAPVRKAELHAYMRTSGGAPNVYFYPMSNDWSWNSITWNNRPAYTEGQHVAVTKWGGGTTWSWTGDPSQSSRVPADLTEYANQIITSGGDKIMSIAIVRGLESDESTWQTGAIRMKSSRAGSGEYTPYLRIEEDVPVYVSEGRNDIIVDWEDHIMAATATPDEPVGPEGEGKYSLASDITTDAVFMKFDLRNIASQITSARLCYYYGDMRTPEVSVYHVPNDTWTGAELTWNKAFGTGEGQGMYMPEESPVATVGIVSSGSNTQPFRFLSIDISPLAAAQQAEDGILSIAVKKTTSTNRNHHIVTSSSQSVEDENGEEIPGAKTRPPYLEIETESTGVTVNDPAFSIGETPIATLQSGVITATVPFESSMYKATRAMVIMGVYEGDRLVDVAINNNLINDARSNGGLTNVSISTTKSVAATENTKVKIFVWQNFHTPAPVAASRTFTVNGLE